MRRPKGGFVLAVGVLCPCDSLVMARRAPLFNYLKPLQGVYCKVSVKSSAQRILDRRTNAGLPFAGKACKEKERPNNRVSEMAKSGG